MWFRLRGPADCRREPGRGAVEKVCFAPPGREMGPPAGPRWAQRLIAQGAYAVPRPELAPEAPRPSAREAIPCTALPARDSCSPRRGSGASRPFLSPGCRAERGTSFRSLSVGLARSEGLSSLERCELERVLEPTEGWSFLCQGSDDGVATAEGAGLCGARGPGPAGGRRAPRPCSPAPSYHRATMG